MIEAWRLLTDAACHLGALAYGPVRRQRELELRAHAAIGSVLVFNEVAGLGNLVLLSGLLLNLRRLYPDAHIAVAMPASPLARSLLSPELVDEFLWCESSPGTRRSLLPFAWRVLRSRHFDLGLGTFFSPTLLTSFVLALAGCRYRLAYAQTVHRGPLNTITLIDGGGHELDRHLRLLEFTGQRLERRTAVSLTAQAAGEALRFLARHGLGAERPLLGVHPGCDRVNALKRWPAERFMAVIGQVVAAEMADVLVFLGPDDEELAARFAAHASARVRVVSGEPIEWVTALIGQCRVFLSNDSGLMHVAAAFGVPVVAAFGPTDTLKNTPVGDAVTLTARGVSCRPCYSESPVTCWRDRRYCLEGISVDEVMAVLEPRLTSGRAVSRTPGGMAVKGASNAAA